NLLYKRQYLGSLNLKLDTIITIRLLKKGFKKECFDRIVSIGLGGYYEKYQRIKTINLNNRKIE
ncbi:MAG: hypothetical protein J7K64_05655, partial [Bacteroidales bacterium]|nr:hypothetical protein [Bacteroidales bacterium]